MTVEEFRKLKKAQIVYSSDTGHKVKASGIDKTDTTKPWKKYGDKITCNTCGESVNYSFIERWQCGCKVDFVRVEYKLGDYFVKSGKIEAWY